LFLFLSGHIIRDLLLFVYLGRSINYWDYTAWQYDYVRWNVRNEEESGRGLLKVISQHSLGEALRLSAWPIGTHSRFEQTVIYRTDDIANEVASSPSGHTNTELPATRFGATHDGKATSATTCYRCQQLAGDRSSCGFIVTLHAKDGIAISNKSRPLHSNSCQFILTLPRTIRRYNKLVVNAAF